MARSKSTSSGAAAVGVVLAFIALLGTIPVVAALSDLRGSDAAGARRTHQRRRRLRSGSSNSFVFSSNQASSSASVG